MIIVYSIVYEENKILTIYILNNSIYASCLNSKRIHAISKYKVIVHIYKLWIICKKYIHVHAWLPKGSWVSLVENCKVMHNCEFECCRFMVNRRIFVVGFGLYGSIHGPAEYVINIQVHCIYYFIMNILKKNMLGAEFTY